METRLNALESDVQSEEKSVQVAGYDCSVLFLAPLRGKCRAKNKKNKMKMKSHNYIFSPVEFRVHILATNIHMCQERCTV